MEGISACLLGIPCRYDGKGQFRPDFADRAARGGLLPLCPEMLGGLPCPREAAEIVGGSGEDVLAGRARVMGREGSDLTGAFVEGARRALALCRQYGIDTVYVKSRSPSCGCGVIHDGGFSGGLRPGDGVWTALLKREGIRVVCIE